MSILISYWNGGSKPINSDLLCAAVRNLSSKNKVNLVTEIDYDLDPELWPIAKIKAHLDAPESVQVDCDVLWDYPVSRVIDLANELKIDAIYQRREAIVGNNVYQDQNLPQQPIAFNAGFTYLSEKAKELINECLKGRNFTSFQQTSTFEQIWIPHYLQSAGMNIATLEDLVPLLPTGRTRSTLWAKCMYQDFHWRSFFILKCWIDKINFLHLVGETKDNVQISKVIADYEAP